MKTLNLIIGIVTLSMILFSCSMGTISDARISNIQLENPAHIQIADVKPGETFYISVKIDGKTENLNTTEPVMVDLSPITGNEPGTNLFPMNDEGIEGDKEAADATYTCAYTLPYGNEDGIDGGVYSLNIFVKDVYNNIICEDICELNIKALPPVIEYAYIDGGSYKNIIHRTESDEISVAFTAKVSSYNGHNKDHNGFDVNGGGYVKVEIPPELNAEVLGSVYLVDDGTDVDGEAWDCEFNGSFSLKPTFAPDSFEVTFYVRNNAGVEVSKSLMVNVKSDITYVSTTGNDETGDGSSNAPFKTIQKGIDESVYGVKVLPGTYSGEGNRDINFNGKDITLESVNGAKYTIIDCEGSQNDPHRGFIFEEGESELAQIKDFTIRNGYGSEELEFEDNLSIGGAILCRNFSTPTFENLIIANNKADFGAGIACYNSSSATIISCEFTKNKSQSNDVTSGGGAIGLFSGSDAIIANCLIAGNTVDNNGAGIMITSSRPTISNCTIADNTSKTYGGGLYVDSYSVVTVHDTIIWDNKADKGNEIYITDTMNNIFFKNSCIDDSNNDRFDAALSMDFGMGGNLSSDPVFEPGSRGKYYLKHASGKGNAKSSPCVDAGSKNAEALEYLDGRTTNVQGFDDTGVVDLGYHYQK